MAESPPQLRVVRGPPSLVVPAEQVEENHGSLYLTNLDQNIAVAIETLYVFQGKPVSDISDNGDYKATAQNNNGVENGDSKKGHEAAAQNGSLVHLKSYPDPARVLKDALAKVLVSYYPLTGRLGISSEGKLEVRLTGEGMVFVEAEANLELSQLHYDASNPNPEVTKELVYRVHGATNILQVPPVVAQVRIDSAQHWHHRCLDKHVRTLD